MTVLYLSVYTRRSACVLYIRSRVYRSIDVKASVLCRFRTVKRAGVTTECGGIQLLVYRYLCKGRVVVIEPEITIPSVTIEPNKISEIIDLLPSVRCLYTRNNTRYSTFLWRF